jgi:hypothetical protein
MKIKYETKETSQYALKPKTNLDVELINSIPLTKATEKAYKVLSEGDEKPFEFVQEVKFGEKYPASDGSIFLKEFIESYISKLEEAPIVGSAYGHTALNAWSERVENHTYMIGAKIVDDETVLFRQYVSRDMDDAEYKKLVKEIKSGLLSTSIQSLVKWKIEAEDEDDEWIWYAEESVGNERNDIVEWNQTGMAAKLVGTSQKAITGENKHEGVTSMNLDEAIALIKETSQKVGSDMKGIAEKLGFSDILITDAQKEKLKTLDEVSQKVGGDIVAFVDKTIASQKEGFASMKEIALKKAFKENEEAIGIASDLIGDEPMTAGELEAKIALVSEKKSIKDALSRGTDTRTKTNGQKEQTSGTKVYAV